MNNYFSNLYISPLKSGQVKLNLNRGLHGRTLRKMYKKNTHCCYCGKHTILNRVGGSAKDNTATIEHIYSAYDIRRNIKKGARKMKLACYKCNWEKGLEIRRLIFDDYIESYYQEVNLIELLGNTT